MKNKVYKYVADRVVKRIEERLKAIEEGREKSFSWIRPWGPAGLPFNDNLGRYYTGINTLLLEKGGAYLSEKQLLARGLKLKPNAEKHMVVFWSIKTKKVSKDEEKKDNLEEAKLSGEEISEEEAMKKSIVFRYYIVYHESDIEGFERKHHIESKREQMTLDEKHDKAVNVLTSYCENEGISFSLAESNQAYYIPTEDKIICPQLSQYKSSSEFISTVAHECIHSTGSSKRLKRDLSSQSMKSKSYSMEELIAEIGACMYLSTMGIESEEANDNSVAYIRSWLKVLKNDPVNITYAAQRAYKALEYILKYDSENIYLEGQDEYKLGDD